MLTNRSALTRLASSERSYRSPAVSPVPGEHHVIAFIQKDVPQLVDHGQGEILLIDVHPVGIRIYRAQRFPVVAGIQYDGVLVGGQWGAARGETEGVAVMRTPLLPASTVMFLA